MKKTALWTLLAVNVALLLGFLLRAGGASPALAQLGGAPAAAPGDYLMIPGEVINGNDSVVYVLDQTNHLLSALVYDDTTASMSVMPPVKLDRLFSDTRNPGGNRAATP